MEFYKPQLLKAIYIYQDHYFFSSFDSEKLYSLQKQLFCNWRNRIEYSNKPNLYKYLDKKLKYNNSLDLFLQNVHNFETEHNIKIEWKFL